MGNRGAASQGDGADRADGARAFVAVKVGDESWLVDLPQGESTLVGPRGSGALVELDAGSANGARPLAAQGRVAWDGVELSIEPLPGETPLFVAGKRVDEAQPLAPGDELSIGPAHLVVGLSSTALPASRRALTHHEFKERIAEEMARAQRVGRPTTLVMAQARPGDGGKLIQSAIERFRAGDVVACYAHDEIELLLPDTPRERAESVAARVIAAAELSGVSFGVAVAPADADHPERLLRAARNALRATLEQTGRVPPSHQGDEPELHDTASRALVESIDAMLVDGPSILLLGEASAGKVAFARLAHRRGQSRGELDGALVVIRCASLVDASSIRAALAPGGEADLAIGGTLVIDEVTELSAEGQAVLLHTIERVGSGTRLVATAQRSLGSLAERGAFSPVLADLLSRRVLTVPPLRERPDDIVPLARRFAEEWRAAEGGDAGMREVRFSPGALARLRSYPWPGNVLELRNAMERAIRLSSGGEILAEHLPGEVLPASSGDGRLREHVDGVERDAIVKALAEANHNQTHAARRLGLSRRALIYKMEKYGLKPPPGAARRRA